MRKLSILVEGRIPVHTECPFVTQCGFKQSGMCKHLGVEHTVPFSCAAARAFDLIQQMGARK